jgi:hypothetical protein
MQDRVKPHSSGNSGVGYAGGGGYGGGKSGRAKTTRTGIIIDLLPRFQSEQRIKLGTSIIVSRKKRDVNIIQSTNGVQTAPETSQTT